MTSIQSQGLLQIPPSGVGSPHEIIKRAFAWARATLIRALDATETAILKLPISYFLALIISWFLRSAVAQFVKKLNMLATLAGRNWHHPPIQILDEHIQSLSEIDDAVTALAEETD